jgi:hypothetical protein
MSTLEEWAARVEDGAFDPADTTGGRLVGAARVLGWVAFADVRLGFAVGLRGFFGVGRFAATFFSFVGALFDFADIR